MMTAVTGFEVDLFQQGLTGNQCSALGIFIPSNRHAF